VTQLSELTGLLQRLIQQQREDKLAAKESRRATEEAHRASEARRATEEAHFSRRQVMTVP
jgi:hypothetical protein